MNTIKLAIIALRNLKRNSRRTVITVLVSSAGFAALAIVGGYMDFTFSGLQEMTICRGFSSSGGTGHLQVFRKEASQKEEHYPLEYGIADYDELQRKLMSVGDVDATLPRIEFTGMISNGEKSTSFLGVGVNPAKELMLTKYWDTIYSGSKKNTSQELMFRKLAMASSNGVLLGAGMAKALGADVGSSLMLMGTTVDGAVNVVDVTVAGIMNNTMKTIDKYYLVTGTATAQNLMQTDKVSKILLVLNETKKTNHVLSAVSSKINAPGTTVKYAVTPWYDLAEYYHSVKDAYRIIFGFTGIIVILIVFLSAANTMLMSTMERVREIGTLKAVGISNKWISLMFLYEGFFIGVMSIAGGILFKEIFTIIINTGNFEMPPPPGMTSTYFLRIYPAIHFLPWISLLLLFSTTCSGFLTMFKIRKLSIVNSLTHV
ncbi:MAG: ABC transporter permease [Chlorobiaceae bacterium]|nr:ABC transporter permease [Chlorobiaceae bacterium]NTV60393.1 ABC transporter permease [Chlorobiaceae bacterium]